MSVNYQKAEYPLASWTSAHVLVAICTIARYHTLQVSTVNQPWNHDSQSKKVFNDWTEHFSHQRCKQAPLDIMNELTHPLSENKMVPHTHTHTRSDSNRRTSIDSQHHIAWPKIFQCWASGKRVLQEDRAWQGTIPITRTWCVLITTVLFSDQRVSHGTKANARTRSDGRFVHSTPRLMNLTERREIVMRMRVSCKDWTFAVGMPLVWIQKWTHKKERTCEIIVRLGEHISVV